ncbi:MAG: hypothetical protein ACR2OU_20725 [Thermomicrobiales bacterium]
MAKPHTDTRDETGTLVFSYTLEQAMNDEVLVAVFRPRWGTLTGGKPLVATAAIRDALTDAALIEIWNDYVTWRQTVEPTLPEEDRLFATQMNDLTVWVIEDGQAFTILYPEDY